MPSDCWSKISSIVLGDSNRTSKFTPTQDLAAQGSGGGGERFSYAVGGNYTYVGQWTPGTYTRTRGGYGSLRSGEAFLVAEASARLGIRKKCESQKCCSISFRPSSLLLLT